MDESGKGNSPTVHDTRGDDEDGYKAPVKESGSDPDEVTAEEEVLVVQDGGGKQESETDELLDHPEVEEVDFEPQEWKAPDGGWGWVVMLNAMAISIIVDGITYTFGIFLGEFEAEFRAPKSEISLASSVQVGAYLMIGPVASALTNRFGCRNVILAGSVIAAVAYLLSYFSDSVMVLVITYGFIGGIGLGMMYLPAIVSVSLYFDKKRALATCTASCGSGIGTFIMAPLAEWLLNEYNWRWTLVIQAGIILNGLVFGALTRPLDFGWTERMTNEKMDGIDMDKIEKGGKRNNEVAVLRGRKESEEGRGEMKRKRHSSTGSRHSSEGGHWLVLGRGAGRTRHLSGSTILSSSRARGLNIRNPIPQIILTDHDEKTTVVLLAGRKPSEETDEGNAKSVKASQFSSTPNMNVISSSTPNTKPYKRTSQGDASQVSPAHSPHDQSWVPLGLSFISLSEMHLNQSHEEKRTNMSRYGEQQKDSETNKEWEEPSIEDIRGIARLMRSGEEPDIEGREKDSETNEKWEEPDI
ncbi:monocarboxylate transporter 12 [Plakobranchus ocellatus]|uniref:Monocarboxylate transporter 12 n=1 Tax=Plakobranchus ocellatus TaxID=259542 RepID=A0AAV3ZXW2_9GAST|nr:monocarboxylate transporter 12 [Plakobranchus ocellatus]